MRRANRTKKHDLRNLLHGFVVERKPSKEGTGIIVQSCLQLMRHHRVTSISGGGACMGIVWLQKWMVWGGGVVDTW
jgi:hypothetical protein